MKTSVSKVQRKEFELFVHAIGVEIEQAQVKLVAAANVQMLLHYWKIGHFILFNQEKSGWGGKVIEKISQAIRNKYPEKKGYSPRNLKYMCQFARQYPLEVLKQLLIADKELENPTAAKVLAVAKVLDKSEIAQERLAQLQAANSAIGQEPLAQLQAANSAIGQEPLAQLQVADTELDIIGQEPLAQLQAANSAIGQEPLAQLQVADTELTPTGQETPAQIQDIPLVLAQITHEPLAQIESVFANSPVSKINWASHVILMNSNLKLGFRYWYMKQSVEFGWSSTILDLQIKSGLFQRQVEKQKVNNFTATLPKPQSDLAGYLLKDPYIFDLAGIREQADERSIEEQLVNHVTKYLLEMGAGFAFVARQKHFQIGKKDFYVDLILYSIKLHAYVVVELKATPFKPEYAGQLNFYINVVNDKLKGEHDSKTIGLLLCRGKDEIMAQYALKGYNQPIGVSDYQLSKAIPEELKSALPTIEDVEQELTHLLAQKERKK
ncbi:MAG: PDDEXK nuclease domain-containing protein [Prevotellaceae bacterium]|jgi:predicted nuclease of restriction endonuclease-like (RecB) superfamily|nr:PDDEXK nuclease domain-containing protein [Prevotellaceae bacterium]